jgi:hypothetical protein
MTGPRITPADSLPPLHRLLTPDEFHAAQTLSPEALATPGLFPTLPPVPKAAADATATRLPKDLAAAQNPSQPTVGQAQPGNLPAHGAAYNAVWDFANYADPVVRGFIDDVIHKPLKALVNLVPESAIINAGKETIERSAKGDNAGAAMTALATVPFLAMPLSRESAGYLTRIRESWQMMHEGAPQMAEARGILRATTGNMAAKYEQAAFHLDEFRRIIDPLPDQQKLAFIHAIETGEFSQASPEALASVGADVKGNGPRQPTPSGAAAPPLPTGIADIGNEAHPSSDAARASARAEPTDMAIPADVLPHRLRMAKINGAMAARGGDPVTVNPYQPESPLHAAWTEGHAGVPPEDFGAENVLQEHAGGLTPEDVKQIHADLGEERQIAAAAKAKDATPAPALNAQFRELATTIRSTLDGARDEIRALGTGKLENFIEDYFPHIWDDPEKAADAFRVIGAKGPLEGPASFLKERTIPTTQEGIAAGLKPVSTNPIDLTLLKLREMQRYLMAHNSLNELKDAGLVKYVPTGGVVPDGHSLINDKIATVFGPREGAVTLPEGANISPEDVSVPGRRIMGQYYAPEPVAGLLNNYLSPGLATTLQKAFPGPTGRAAAMTYDAYKGLGNVLNQAQLGFSAFHLGFTSLDAATSRTALGLEYIASGKPLTGLGKIITSPIAALPGIIQGTLGDAANALTRTATAEKLGIEPTNIAFGLGAKIRAAYLNPENASPEMQAMANAVKEAGGRIRQDSFYQNNAISKFWDAYHADTPAVALHMLPALMEMTSKPIMEHIVPLQKLQVFGEMAQKALAELPQDASLAERRAALGSAWDSADNRMGQLVYDNLFWNKTFKDLAMASTRSVGWNLGTIRELGGGLTDFASGVAKEAATGETQAMSHRTAYVLGLPLTVGLMGAAYQYLRTGQGPTELKDYFFPRTGDVDADGQPERVQLPSYMKDMFAYSGHPWQTITHKVAPLPSMVAEMMGNQDFYGDEIRNPHDPVVQQLKQEAEYLGRTASPFAWRNFVEQGKRGDDVTTRASSFVGITPAKREDVRSDAENRMHEYIMERGSGGKTPEMVDAQAERAQILSGLRGNTGVDLEQSVTKAIEHGSITPPALAKLMKRAGLTPDQDRFKTLTLPQALDVFQRSTDREKAKFAEILAKKIEKAQK